MGQQAVVILKRSYQQSKGLAPNGRKEVECWNDNNTSGTIFYNSLKWK